MKFYNDMKWSPTVSLASADIDDMYENIVSTIKNVAHSVGMLNRYNRK